MLEKIKDSSFSINDNDFIKTKVKNQMQKVKDQITQTKRLRKINEAIEVIEEDVEIKLSY